MLMVSNTEQQIDLIDEFRLRRWARENYVPVESRDEAWHEVVLNEMSSIDLESRSVRWHESAEQRTIPGTSQSLDRRDQRTRLRVLDIDAILETA